VSGERHPPFICKGMILDLTDEQTERLLREL
jgi:hypothetical protein